MQDTSSRIPLFCLIMGLYGLSWYLQTTLLFNSDVSWFLVIAKRLLDGGTYTHDFFELNPPMSIYLYVPAVWLAKLTGLRLDRAAEIMIYLLATLSLGLCTRLLVPSRIKNITLILLSVIFLILPLAEWGQREHLMLMLVTPYLLCVARRLQMTEALSARTAVGIGLLAGCGFAVKPFFLLTWLAVESYYYLVARQWRRPENAGIFIILCLYGLLLLTLQRDYLTLVVPLVTQFYYQKYSMPWLTLVFSDQALFAYSVLLFYGLTARRQPLQTVLAIATSGFLVAYVVQRMPWYYHLLPFFSLATVLCAQLITLWMLRAHHARRTQMGVLLLLCALFYFGWRQVNPLQFAVRYYPAGYFALFAIIAGCCLFTRPALSWQRASLLLGITLLSGVLLRAYLLHSPLQTHLLLFTASLMLLVLLYCVPDKTVAGKGRAAYAVLTGLILLAFPCYEAAYLYAAACDYRQHYHRWLSVLNQYPQKRIIIFSSTADFSFPAVLYTNQPYASRFSALDWVPALSFHDSDPRYAEHFQAERQHLGFFTPALVQDIQDHAPDLILVDMRNTDVTQGKAYFGSQALDFVRFFSQDDGFARVWKNYHYVKTVDGQPLFKFRIYARDLPGEEKSLTLRKKSV